MDLEEYYEWLREKTWFGQNVQVRNLKFKDLREHIPKFRREPFGNGEDTNSYLDQIIRLPIKKDERTIPVAAVSRRYALVQHHEVIDWLGEGIEACRFNSADIGTELVMSEYGERIRINIKLPEASFNPGDGYRVDQFIEARNSVDRSCALEFFISRIRLICLNGMWISDQDKLRKIHNIDWMNRESVAGFINIRVQHLSLFENHIHDLINFEVNLKRIETWVDSTLAKSWGVQEAARVYHILKSGYDGRVGRASKNVPVHDYPVSSDIEVPGACAPVNNLYHLCQAMSWVAGKRKTIESSDIALGEIPKLIEPLMK